jgi:hypothetical protein
LRGFVFAENIVGGEEFGVVCSERNPSVDEVDERSGKSQQVVEELAMESNCQYGPLPSKKPVDGASTWTG